MMIRKSEVAIIETIGRCSRCGEFLIEEQSRKHRCDFRKVPIKACEEVVLDHITDSGEDENRDHVHLAWALDGMLYRLLVCKHNPPHSAKRNFTADDKRPPDKLPVYLVGGC